jgi:DNA-binding NarL/FixJ family response regulator
MTARRRIVIVDDHPLLALALCAELERSGVDVAQLDPNPGPDQLVETISTDRPDCAVLDLGLPFPGGGSTLIEPLVEREIRVVVLTGETDRRLLARSSAAGAEVVLTKTEALASIVDAILLVAAGQEVRPGQRGDLAAEFRQLSAEQQRRQAPFDELSPRERQVLAGLMDGEAPAVLAERNYVSVATVRSQVKSLLSKLGVSSQLEAVAMAHRSHWNPTRDES